MGGKMWKAECEKCKLKIVKKTYLETFIVFTKHLVHQHDITPPHAIILAKTQTVEEKNG